MSIYSNSVRVISLVHSLTIENFKSIIGQDLHCRRVNVFIGPPNSGKSNILESIGVLSGIARFPNILLNQFVRMRSMVDWFSNKSLKNPIRIGYSTNYPSREDLGLGISFEQGSYHFKLERMVDNANQKWEFNVEPNGFYRGAVQWSFLDKFKFYRFREQERFSVGPPDYLEPPSGSNLLGVLLSNESLLATVNELCSNIGFRLVLKEAEQSIELQKEFRSNVAVSFPLSFTSEGVQQAIFVLAAIYSNRNSIITLEEPESHTFPYNTKALAETVGLDERGNQYFITTHNPYFLTSLIEKTPKDQIAVFITSFQNQETTVASLNEDNMAALFEAGADAFFNLQTIAKK